MCECVVDFHDSSREEMTRRQRMLWFTAGVDRRLKFAQSVVAALSVLSGLLVDEIRT